MGRDNTKGLLKKAIRKPATVIASENIFWYTYTYKKNFNEVTQQCMDNTPTRNHMLANFKKKK